VAASVGARPGAILSAPSTPSIELAPPESAPAAASRQLRFDQKIVLVTVLPWFLILVAGQLGERASVLVDLPLILLGTPHVLATTALFVDPGLRPHVRAHRAFYVLAPIITIGGCFVVFAFSPAALVEPALVALLLWQIWHFTKQNVGMLAFWTKARGIAGPSTAERRLVLGTAVIGMAGILHLAQLDPLIDDVAVAVGLAATAVLAVAAVVIGWRQGPVRVAALLAAVLFYAPVLVIGLGVITAALAYQAAHGAQYYLMVGTATRPTKRSGTIGIVLLVTLGPVFALPGLLVDPFGATAWLLGLYKGVIAWHFVADSRLWRLRDPTVRGFMKERFSFL
jgi:hypothetical protein